MGTSKDILIDKANEWQEIAESRMKEIKRLRDLIQIGRGFNATFVKEVGTEQTGGGVMVDSILLKDSPCVIGVSDDCIVLYKNLESFCGDESGQLGHIYFPVEESKDEYFTRFKKIGFLEEAIKSMENFLFAWQRLNETWNKDSVNGIDLNDYWVKMYPFEKSFDELQNDVALWYADGASKLVQLKYELQPNLADRNNLEESQPEYKTVRVEIVEKSVLSVLVNIPKKMEEEALRDQIDSRGINWDSFEKDADREMYTLINEEKPESKEDVLKLKNFYKRYFPMVEEEQAPYPHPSSFHAGGGTIEGLFNIDDEESCQREVVFQEDYDKVFNAYKRLFDDMISEEPQAEYNKTLTLEVGWKTEDCWQFDIEKIQLEISKSTIDALKYAMIKCKKNKWFCIEVWCDDPLTLTDSDGKEEEEWRSGAEYYKVYPDTVYLFMSHKHNPQAQIESEAFSLVGQEKVFAEESKLDMVEESANFQYECLTLDEVITKITTIDKQEYIYVIRSKNKYFVENNEPFVRSWESVIAKGKALTVLNKIEKLKVA